MTRRGEVRPSKSNDEEIKLLALVFSEEVLIVNAPEVTFQPRVLVVVISTLDDHHPTAAVRASHESSFVVLVRVVSVPDNLSIRTMTSLWHFRVLFEPVHPVGIQQRFSVIHSFDLRILRKCNNLYEHHSSLRVKPFGS